MTSDHCFVSSVDQICQSELIANQYNIHLYGVHSESDENVVKLIEANRFNLSYYL